MGVPGLVALLRKHAPAAFERCTEAHLRGKRVGVDLSITVYRGAAGCYKNGPLSHLETLLREVRWLLRLGCTPVYVVDGDAPEEKREELEKREAARKENEARLEAFLAAHAGALHEDGVQEKLQALQRRCLRVTAEMKEDARKLLVGLGVELVQARSEAEHCLAALMTRGLVDLALTEDVDVLVCGSPSYVKNAHLLMYDSERELEGLSGLFTEGTEGKAAELVHLAPVLQGLGLSREGFALLAVFSGCDFAPKIPRFGPATAWKLVKKHEGDLDACFADVKEEHRGLLERYRRGAQLFLQEDGERRSTRAPPSPELLEGLLDKLRSQGQQTLLLQTYMQEALELQGAAEEQAARRPRVGSDEAPQGAEAAAVKRPRVGGDEAPQGAEASEGVSRVSS